MASWVQANGQSKDGQVGVATPVDSMVDVKPQRLSSEKTGLWPRL